MIKKKYPQEYWDLIACQMLEDRLTKAGWSGSSYGLKNLRKAYNRKFGTQFKNAYDVLQFFKRK